MPEPTFYKLELEQDAYGSAVISLPDELEIVDSTEK